ncbi:MAG: hypothetical protein IMW98_08565 [Firmicutes bacterium]|nr:hypothetical protein [Bacillota bacterium]MBE3590858.1 hypothetical protein [Bacillota bacterium]
MRRDGEVELYPAYVETSEPMATCIVCGRPMDGERITYRGMRLGSPMTPTQVLRCPEGCAAVRVWYTGALGELIAQMIREAQEGR